MSTKIKKIFPLLVTTMAVPKHHVNLLYIIADEKPPHVLVKDLSRLVSNQYSNHKGNTFFCQYCLHSCISEEVLKNNLERCKLHRLQRIKLPEADDKMGRGKVKFTKADCKLRLSFVLHVLHHPIPATCSMWELHLIKMEWWTILWTTTTKYGGWCCWKVFVPGPSHSNRL